MWSANDYVSAYDKHKKLVNDYLLLRDASINSIKRDTSRDKTDYDVIRENHRFLWDERNDIPNTWGAQLAKKYYDKLFKEYCICDLTYYKYNKVALRWRTEKEVVIGKGQFECGNKKCSKKEGLRSWEVNFGYIEQGEKKNALVKLRLCPECSTKLNYRSQKREVKRSKAVKRLRTSSKERNISEAIVNNKVHQDVENSEAEQSATVGAAEKKTSDESEVWKEKPTANVEKSREEEFEEYLADLLL